MTCINTKQKDRTLRRLKRLVANQIGDFEDQARRAGAKPFRRRRRTPKAIAPTDRPNG
jgi:hypothetical protein